MFESLEVRKVKNGFVLVINNEDDVVEYIFDSYRKLAKFLKDTLDPKAPN